MKFDFAIGNPPYQEESETESTINGQKPRKNIFHYFQIEADKITKQSSVMIYPGGRWIHQSGKGLQQFGKELINDKKVSTIEFFPDSKEVFNNSIDIPDGISIVVKNNNKVDAGFNYIYAVKGTENKIHTDNPGEKLMPLNPNDILIVNKISNFVVKNKLHFLHDSILPRSLFSVESDFVEKNPDKVREYYEGCKLASDEIKLFTNDKAGSAGRSKWFIVKEGLITSNRNLIKEWQVVVSSAHGGGQEGRDNQLAIIDNCSAFGRARVALRSFKTLKEAQNFYNYVKTDIVRYAFLMTDEALSALGKQVPDILDYTDENIFVDFSKEDIDNQLNKLLGLTDNEITYVKEVINGSNKKGVK